MARKWGRTEMYGSTDAVADVVSFNQQPEYREKETYVHATHM